MIRCTLIRAQVVADLKAAAIPNVGDRVYPSRSRKVWPQEGQAVVLVYTQETDADDEDTAPTRYRNRTSIVVQVVGHEVEDLERDNDEQSEDLEALLDTIADAVVRTLQPVHGIAGPLGGLVDWVRWKGERPAISAEGEVLRNSRQILFSAEWSLELPDDQPTADFLRMGAQVGAPTGANVPPLTSPGEAPGDPDNPTDMRTP